MDDFEEAKKRASRYAPPPKLNPIITGIWGGLIAMFSAQTFALLARLDWERFERAAILTALLGFLVPFLYLKNQERLHNKARFKEYLAMQKEKESPQS